MPDGNERATFILENWERAVDGSPEGDTLEHPLFTDARLVDEVVEGLGPYQLINTINDPQRHPRAAGAVLRITYFIGDNIGAMDRTDFARHHGGFPEDEIAALLSLSLGARFKAGSATRWFRPGDDPKGRPWSFRQYREDPSIERSLYGPILPTFQGERRLSDIAKMRRLRRLRPAQSVALVRAARQYQEAVWIAEGEPHLSWLFLVSATEVAANQWRAEAEAPVDRLRASRPQIEELLNRYDCSNLLEPLAALVAPYMGATRKFLDFLLTFLPEPPPQRADEYERISWDTKSMKSALSQVYDYRSKALHAATPFPAPLCLPPRRSGVGFEERSAGSAAGFMGSVWLTSDLPMLLHVFEYIVRGALLTWWESMLEGSASLGSG